MDGCGVLGDGEFPLVVFVIDQQSPVLVNSDPKAASGVGIAMVNDSESLPPVRYFDVSIYVFLSRKLMIDLPLENIPTAVQIPPDPLRTRVFPVDSESRYVIRRQVGIVPR
jgi:hypothetical protein